MKYLVYMWKSKNGETETDFREFYLLEDANEYADAKSDYYREHGYEFNVRVYELIG